jgi:hypothetical protein
MIVVEKTSSKRRKRNPKGRPVALDSLQSLLQSTHQLTAPKKAHQPRRLSKHDSRKPKVLAAVTPCAARAAPRKNVISDAANAMPTPDVPTVTPRAEYSPPDARAPPAADDRAPLEDDACAPPQYSPPDEYATPPDDVCTPPDEEEYSADETRRAPPEADRRASEDEPDAPEPDMPLEDDACAPPEHSPPHAACLSPERRRAPEEPDTQDDEPGDCSAFLRGRHHLPEDDDEVHTGWVSRNPVDVHAWWDA